MHVRFVSRVLGWVSAIVASAGLLVSAIPQASATPQIENRVLVGGSTIYVPVDNVWRTRSWSAYDNNIPSGCPGNTSQGVAIQAQIKGNASGMYIQNIYLTNRTGTTLSFQMTWDARVMLGKPNSSWANNTTRLVTRPTYPGSITLSDYDTWASNTIIHELVLSNGCGAGFNPVLLLAFKKS